MRVDIRAYQGPSGEWYAHDDLTYDVDCIDGSFCAIAPVGCGNSKFEAMRDLIDCIEEEEEVARAGSCIG